MNQAGLDTGLESCDDGTTRRRAALDCPTERTSPTSPCSPFTPTACSADADCTREPNGYCADAHRLTGYCGCYYGCRRDSDCEPGSLCECGVVVGRCVPAECTTNADCDAGLGCVATAEGSAGTACNSIGSGRASLYACQSASDECAGDAECPSSGNDPGVCVLDGDRRACGTVCAMTP